MAWQQVVMEHGSEGGTAVEDSHPKGNNTDAQGLETLEEQSDDSGLRSDSSEALLSEAEDGPAVMNILSRMWTEMCGVMKVTGLWTDVHCPGSSPDSDQVYDTR